MKGISKQDLLAQVQDPKTKATLADLGNDSDEMTSLLFQLLHAAYKAQQRLNQDLQPGQYLNSLTAPAVQQQTGSEGNLYVVKTISLRVVSPISEDTLPLIG